MSDPKNSTRELLQLINSCSNVAGYKINSKKSVALFLQMINGLRKNSEKFTIATNSIKYLAITLTKQVEDLYDKNFKTLKKKLKTPGNGKISHALGYVELTLKMAILPKAIYRFNAIPVKIPAKFFTDLERTRLNFIWKRKNSRIAKTLLYSKGTSGAPESMTSNSTTELQY